MNNQKILIVDDDRTVLKLYKMILEQKGFQKIEIAHNGKEAVLKYKGFEEKPNIIIMDHRMPLVSGMDAMKKIIKINNKENISTKIIFASADSTVREQVISLGAYDFISKPFDIEELIVAIKKALSLSIQK
jgi:DNA-binding NtrC family response regulator